MKLSQIPKEELELMGYDEIALLILQESGKKMKIQDIFKKVCKVLELPENMVEEHLVDFFELMSTNKKFIMLQNGFWDLQSRHKMDVIIEEEEEDEEELMEDEEEIEENDEDIFYDGDEETDDVTEDDLADLVVIDTDDDSNL